jgi:hypothetical protein
MADSPPPAVSAEDALRLYQGLRDRDPTAAADFAAAFLRPLVDWLESRNPSVDPAAWAEAAGEAIVHFLNHLTTYDPHRLGLEAYLRMAAQRDLLNVLRKEWRHQKNRTSWQKVVDLEEDEGKYLGREEDPSLPLQIEEARQKQRPPEGVWRQMTAVERRVWEEMEQGEHRQEVFAAILGVGHLPVAEQEREVKRVKDRLKRRVQRARENQKSRRKD